MWVRIRVRVKVRLVNGVLVSTATCVMKFSFSRSDSEVKFCSYLASQPGNMMTSILKHISRYR